MVVMVVYANLCCMVALTLLASATYLASVRPGAWEKRIGPSAYVRSNRYRSITAVLIMLITITYVLYALFPLPMIPPHLAWRWWISALIACLLATPGLYLTVQGVSDTGEGTLVVRKDQPLYAGIYRHIRHPQAVGELLLWLAIAFLLHSPFLVFYSLLWLPLHVWFCLAEERDLLLRYGEAYQAYQQQAGFWWPRIRGNTGA
ncbi:MAG: hypothetical protein GYB65_02870 [Chloroflexi bacterium]|nr:hypothetical protein [Chloroflexota bacterium]